MFGFGGGLQSLSALLVLVVYCQSYNIDMRYEILIKINNLYLRMYKYRHASGAGKKKKLSRRITFR